MKIIRFSAERFKRLTAVEITPDGNTVVISGRNGQGKSSILDAIWLALGGAKAAKECGAARPVKDGEKDAIVTLDLGDMTVTRRWKADGSTTLDITSEDGRKFSSPQSLLDSLIGAISFDPLAFARMEPNEQRKRLIDLVHLSIDPDKLEANKQIIYDERTAVNREAKSFEAELANSPVPAAGTPDAEISISALMEEMNAAQSAQQAYNSLNARINDLRFKAMELQKEIEKKKAELAQMVDDGKRMKAELAGMTLADIEGIRVQMENIDKTNAAVRAKQRRAELKKKADEKKEQSESLTKAIKALDDEKEQAFREAKFPIEGLAFDAEGITFKGVPFRQCSSAEQMKVCIAIAAALNPKIRVIRVADASLLDAESLKFVESLAASEDIQIWLEKVTDGEKGVGVTIEDGAVKG